jgi:hypothetical protein
VLWFDTGPHSGERRLPVKFSYAPQFGLRVEPELDSKLSREEAMIVAVRDLAAGMNSLSQAMWELHEEFRYKQFYKRDDQPPHRLDEPPGPAKKASAPARKKPPAVKSKKRGK